ncbi:MAG: hypothetical protein R3D26_04730 [Cyanobacteriota/Melainabacteria group bacterium]
MENYLDSKESEHENSGSGAEVTSDQSGVRDQASGEKKDLHSRYINYIERPEINGVFVGTYRSRALYDRSKQFCGSCRYAAYVWL